jgi:hypothetical protein
VINDPKSFCCWLQGYFELGGENLSPQQVQIIKDHLALVFNKVTPNYNFVSGLVFKDKDPINGIPFDTGVSITPNTKLSEALFNQSLGGCGIKGDDVYIPPELNNLRPTGEINNLFTYSVWSNDKWEACNQMPLMTGMPVDFSTALEDYKNGNLSKHGTVGYVSGPNGGMISTSEFKNFVENTNSGQSVPETYPFVAFNKPVDFPIFKSNWTPSFDPNGPKFLSC